ncbi:MAG: thymidine kinase [Bacteroidales bacterium]|nr:thymidine kinase [Bacteroidales bacterium]
MFLEQKNDRQSCRGWIEVITGSMFSGKTEELMRRLRRAVLAKQRVEVYKPAVDVRYSETDVVSHDANSVNSIAVENANNILLLAAEADVVGIDEAQFFGPEVVDVCQKLAAMGVRVIVAGLDMDYLGKPFGSIPQLMAVAEHVSKMHAICSRCGNLAQYSHRLVSVGNLVLLGSTEQYEPLCRTCYLATKDAESTMKIDSEKSVAE